MTALAQTLDLLGAVLYYPFTERSGSVCRDRSGCDLDGTLVGSPTLGVAGLDYFEQGSCIELNGSTSYVDTSWPNYGV